MNKTQKRQLHIRNKLIAAVAMLLVSSIMMVSTTYAWFTLSTAPEVQGITTTVGTNGNLEIALSPLDGVTSGIKSQVGDSTNGWTVKNTTWGNLLDLSNEEYELGKIDLQPSQLVFSTDGTTNKLDTTSGGLAYPQYGPDGRISTLAKSTQIGFKVQEANSSVAGEIALSEGFQLGATQSYGVRAVGTSSGQTENERVFNSGVSALRSGMNQAANVAATSLNENGQALANMMVEHATATDDTAENYQQYLDEMEALIIALESSVDHIDSALRGALTAMAASKLTGTELTGATNAISNEQNTVSSLVSSYGVTNGYMDKALAQQTVIETAVSNARNAYEAIKNNSTVSWDQAYSVVQHLMNVSYIEVNDMAYTAIKDNTGELVKNIMANGSQAHIELNDGSGVYYEIHEMASKIYAVTTMSVNADLYVSGMGYVDVTTIIETTYSGTTYLSGMLQGVNTLTPATATGESAGVSKLDVYYGYILDFVFRTNAAGSSLQLQSEAANRVYSDGAEATMGSGCTITFPVPAGTDSGIVKGMIEGIRVVFYDTVTGEVYGVAKATSVSSEVTDESTSLVGNLELCSYNVDTTTNRVTVGDKADSAALCALGQNQAKSISVMVSLDGNDITNSDILAEGDISGVLNLQFSSTSKLVPMENTALKNMESFNVTLNGSKVSSVETGGTFSYTIPTATVQLIDSMVIKMGDTDITSTAWNASTGLIKVENATGDIAITMAMKTVTVTQNLTNATISGSTTATMGSAYTFTVTPSENYTVDTVSYTVSGSDTAVTLTANDDGSYTVPATATLTDFTVTVTATAPTT